MTVSENQRLVQAQAKRIARLEEALRYYVRIGREIPYDEGSVAREALKQEADDLTLDKQPPPVV